MPQDRGRFGIYGAPLKKKPKKTPYAEGEGYGSRESRGLPPIGSRESRGLEPIDPPSRGFRYIGPEADKPAATRKKHRRAEKQRTEDIRARYIASRTQQPEPEPHVYWRRAGKSHKLVETEPHTIGEITPRTNRVPGTKRHMYYWENVPVDEGGEE